MKTQEEIQEGSPIFIYPLNQMLAQTKPNFMDFSQFVDELSRFRGHAIGMSVKIGQSYFLVYKMIFFNKKNKQ